MPQQSSRDFLVRKAVPADLDALCSLENASFTTDLLSRRRLRHWIAAGNGILLVAVTRSKPQTLAGYILGFTRRGSDTGRFYSLAIAATARGQGLGGRLLQGAERECRRRGCKSVRLEVAQQNQVAIALYDKRGYVRTAGIAGYYEDGQDAWRMQKQL